MYSTGIPAKDRGFDLSSLPSTETIKPHPGQGYLMLLFGLFLTGFIILISYGIARETPVGWSVLIFSLIGLWLMFSGIRTLFNKKTVSISKKNVQVSERSLFGDKQWEEPLKNYQGILNEPEYKSTGSERSRRTYKVNTIKLHHEDPEKTIKIFETLSDEGFRERWENTARLFALPALEKQDNGIIARDTEDLDKNLQDLLAENKIKIDTEALSHPPPGLKITEEVNRLVLTYKIKGNPLVYIIFLLIPMGMIYAGFFVKKVPVPVGHFGSVFLLVIILLIIINFITTIKVIITPNEVVLENLILSKVLFHQSIVIDEIEQIQIGRKQGETANGIILKSDSKTLQVGTSLPGNSLKWLEATLLKKISSIKNI